MALDYSARGVRDETIVMIVLAVLSTATRFWSRAVVFKGDFRLDDWLAFAASIWILGQFALGFALIDAGLGTRLRELPEKTSARFFQYFYATIIINCVGLTFAKLSELAFYVRVFGYKYSDKSWRISISVTAFLAVAYPLWQIPAQIWLCTPIEKFWAFPVPGSCINEDATLFAAAVHNAVVDVIILVLPVPQLYRLRMTMASKLLITTAFMIGYSVPLVSIGRLVTTVILSRFPDLDLTHDLVPFFYWFVAEPGIALLAISMPPMYQLFTQAIKPKVQLFFSSGRSSPNIASREEAPVGENEQFRNE